MVNTMKLFSSNLEELHQAARPWHISNAYCIFNKQVINKLWGAKIMHTRLLQGYNVVVVLLFYVHGKYLRSCRDGQLPNHTLPGQA